MEKITKIFSASIVLIVCGTMLAIYNQQTFAIILMSLGIFGSVVNFSLQVQKDKEEKEEREKIYDDIKNSLAATGIKIPYVTSAEADQIH